MSKYIFNKANSDYVDVIVPGLPYTNDDRTGSMSIWNISKFFDSIEEYVEKRKSFLEFSALKSENVTFVFIKQVLKVYPDLYKYNHFSDVSLRIVMQLCYPGRTSIGHVTQMTDGKSNKLLAERFVKGVRINNETRRPINNPNWYLENCSHLKEHKMPDELTKTETLDLPSSSFEYRTVVRYSDMDSNLHTRQIVYIKFCFDCATAASLSGKLRNFSGDITAYPVKDISIEYKGESFQGDEILIVMWQGKTDISTLHFVVYKALGMKQLLFLTCHLCLHKSGDRDLKSRL